VPKASYRHVFLDAQSVASTKRLADLHMTTIATRRGPDLSRLISSNTTHGAGLCEVAPQDQVSQRTIVFAHDVLGFGNLGEAPALANYHCGVAVPLEGGGRVIAPQLQRNAGTLRDLMTTFGTRFSCFSSSSLR